MLNDETQDFFQELSMQFKSSYTDGEIKSNTFLLVLMISDVIQVALFDTALFKKMNILFE